VQLIISKWLSIKGSIVCVCVCV